MKTLIILSSICLSTLLLKTVLANKDDRLKISTPLLNHDPVTVVKHAVRIIPNANEINLQSSIFDERKDDIIDDLKHRIFQSQLLSASNTSSNTSKCARSIEAIMLDLMGNKSYPSTSKIPNVKK